MATFFTRLNKCILGNDTGPIVEVEVGHDGWEVATAATVPSLLLVALLLLLVKQNVNALRGLVDSVNRLIEGVDLPSRCFGNERDEPDIEMAARDLPSAGVPRNLTDEEVEQMRNARVGTDWV